MKSVEEVTRLNQSGKERIAALGSEVRRLKMSLAARRGDGETVDMLLGAEEADVIRDLQERLKLVLFLLVLGFDERRADSPSIRRTAENLLLALRDQLHAYTTASPESNATVIADSEMTARAELSTARSRLQKLESLLSPSADGQVELADLAKRLQEKEEQVKVFEAQLKSSEGETNMLYGEVERLSTAWSELDEMCGSKVFGLVGMEEKVQKAQAEVGPFFLLSRARSRRAELTFSFSFRFARAESQSRQPLLHHHAPEGRPRLGERRPHQARREAATSSRGRSGSST